MKRDNPEQRLKRAICELLSYYPNRCFFWIEESVGIFDYRRKVYRASKSPYQKKGRSDILGIWDGKFLAIEVKANKNRLTPEQEDFLDDIRRHGGIGIVAYSIDDVRKVLAI